MVAESAVTVLFDDADYRHYFHCGFVPTRVAVVNWTMMS
jgi:hypothetical protein